MNVQKTIRRRSRNALPWMIILTGRMHLQRMSRGTMLLDFLHHKWKVCVCIYGYNNYAKGGEGKRVEKGREGGRKKVRD